MLGVHYRSYWKAMHLHNSSINRQSKSTVHVVTYVDGLKANHEGMLTFTDTMDSR